MYLEIITIMYCVQKLNFLNPQFQALILNTYIQENNISIVLDKKIVLGGQIELNITEIIVNKLNKDPPSLNLK